MRGKFRLADINRQQKHMCTQGRQHIEGDHRAYTAAINQRKGTYDANINYNMTITTALLFIKWAGTSAKDYRRSAICNPADEVSFVGYVPEIDPIRFGSKEDLSGEKSKPSGKGNEKERQ